MSFPSDDIQDKSFKVKFETKNINSKELSHFYLEVYRDVVEYGQVRYKIADFDTLSKNLDEMTVWREVEPLTRYEVWVTAKGYNNKQLADPTIKKITTKMSADTTLVLLSKVTLTITVRKKSKTSPTTLLIPLMLKNE